MGVYVIIRIIMIIELNKDAFLKGLKAVAPSVSTKLSTPILSTVLLETKDGNLTIKGTDLEMGIETFIDVETKESISICAPLHRMLGFLENLKDKKINLEKKGENYALICKNAKFEFSVFDGSEFPAIPSEKDGVKITIKKEDFQRIVELTSFAASKEETRYELTGVHFTLSKDLIEAAATDGRRLACFSITIDSKLENPIDALIPARICDEVCYILDLIEAKEFDMMVTSKLVVFISNTTKITAKTLEGSFPNYKQVIPKTLEHTAIVEASDLKHHIEKLPSMGFKSEPVRFIFSQGRLTTLCRGVGGYVEDELEADYKGKKLEIGFSANYILDLLKKIRSGKIKFGIKDPTSPVLIESLDIKGFQYVVMPVRLD
ncbi:MAG: DNA polymerase III subunit beta [bacterium]|nr:DNA polymerase III subunit beta [bacterium]